MKKILLMCLGLLLMTGCFQQKNEVENKTALKILSPSGAPAISLAHLICEDQHEIVVVDGSDVLQASFVNPDAEYDMIVAPTNLGVKLAQSGKSEYRLVAVITWGNLYVVAKEGTELSNTMKFAAFGENAVPGLVFERLKAHLSIDDANYYNSVTEAQAALLSSNADAALIAEPAATATIAKGKQNDLNLSIVGDLQALWETETGFDGYPQAGIFIRVTEENEAVIDDVLQQIQTTLTHYENNADALKEDIETASAEKLGVPSSDIIVKSYSRLGLDYRSASECEEELRDFLSLFNIVYDSSIAIR